jgi:DNA repair protein RadA/Sms
MTGEVGLSGEIRPVTRIEQRILEAQKLGMSDILVPRGNLKGIDLKKLTIKVHEVGKVEEAFRAMFG